MAEHVHQEVDGDWRNIRIYDCLDCLHRNARIAGLEAVVTQRDRWHTQDMEIIRDLLAQLAERDEQLRKMRDALATIADREWYRPALLGDIARAALATSKEKP